MAVKTNEGKLVLHKQRGQRTLIEPQDSRKHKAKFDMNPGGIYWRKYAGYATLILIAVLK